MSDEYKVSEAHINYKQKLCSTLMTWLSRCEGCQKVEPDENGKNKVFRYRLAVFDGGMNQAGSNLTKQQLCEMIGQNNKRPIWISQETRQGPRFLLHLS